MFLLFQRSKNHEKVNLSNDCVLLLLLVIHNLANSCVLKRYGLHLMLLMVIALFTDRYVRHLNLSSHVTTIHRNNISHLL